MVKEVNDDEKQNNFAFENHPENICIISDLLALGGLELCVHIFFFHKLLLESSNKDSTCLKSSDTAGLSLIFLKRVRSYV